MPRRFWFRHSLLRQAQGWSPGTAAFVFGEKSCTCIISREVVGLKVNLKISLIKPMKKFFLLPLFLLVFSGCATDYNATTTIPQNSQQNSAIVETPVKKVESPAVVQTQSPAQIQTKAATPTPKADSDLSNNNYYTNSAGNTVHSPAYAPSIPSGASAKCGDGTYSFSQSRRGTCSHHGGVAIWY